MKNLKKMFAFFAMLSICAFQNVAFSADCQKCDVKKEKKVQAYSHPTYFKSDVHQAVDGSSVYVVGVDELKNKKALAMKGKDNVYVSSWSKDVLNLIKSHQTGNFDEKAPVLRSELAVMLSEAFGLKNTNCPYQYSDISSDYWAKNWIYKALNSNLMIGYPSGTFKPDNRVTKAEVFAVVSQIIAVPTDRSLVLPQYNGKDFEYVPRWAIGATKEVVAADILKDLPDQDRITDDEYLSKQQVAVLMGTLRYKLFTGELKHQGNVNVQVRNYVPVCIEVQMRDRIDAKHSNIGDIITAKTLNTVCVENTTFPENSIVKGKVVAVKRPGLHHEGSIKVKFTSIHNGDVCVNFPKEISEADACKIKSPNFIARLLGAPFQIAARTVGVVGRSGAAMVNSTANNLEKYGDQLSDVFVETLSLEPYSGLRSFGSSFVTLGKGVVDIVKVAVSGTFGVIYEISDEIVYTIVPSLSNDSSLNPGETLRIIF